MLSVVMLILELLRSGLHLRIDQLGPVRHLRHFLQNDRAVYGVLGILAPCEWTVTNLLPVASSDAVLMDFDGDGQLELGLISPFHGNSLTIWHLDEFGRYVPQWKYGAPEKETEMLHATWADTILGKPTWIVGWRKGTRCSIAITWDAEAGDYRTELFDSATGMANALHFVRSDGKDILVGTNREVDEVAYYVFSE